MAKDPAFLFYSKDWIEGTAELMPDEKGVYVDLLCYQHQKGSLPADTIRIARLVGLSHEDFLRIWAVIKDKFITDAERTYNRKLNEVMNERSANAYKNKIIGIFSAILRKSKVSQVWKDQVKKAFKVDDFINVPNERINERINEWYNECIHSLEDAIEDEDVNNIKVKKNKDVPRETDPEQTGPKPIEDDVLEPLTDPWFAYIFDEMEIERKTMAYKDHDIPDQLQKFKSKVRGSPEGYVYRDTAGIRSAFDYQLRNTKPDKHYKNGRAANKRSSDAIIEGGRDFGSFE